MGDEISDGSVAFRPEKDAIYRLTLNYTATGTTGIRVRWVKDNTNLSYTNADGIVVNDYVYLSYETAVTIPALFNGDMVNMGSYTLVTEFKMDGSEPADGLVGNIAIRGYQGGNAFSINWMKMEKIDGEDELMFTWDPNNPVPEEPEAEPAPSEPAVTVISEDSTSISDEPSGLPGEDASDSGGKGAVIAAVGVVAAILAAAITVITLISKKKRG
jgi:endo-1,4-beta-xylanase